MQCTLSNTSTCTCIYIVDVIVHVHVIYTLYSMYNVHVHVLYVAVSIPATPPLFHASGGTWHSPIPGRNETCNQ